jgi:hypothetical protein
VDGAKMETKQARSHDIDPLTNRPFEAYDTVSSRVRFALREAARTVAARQSGSAGFIEKTLYEGDPYPRKAATAVAELKALVALRDGIRGALYQPVAAARGEGLTWTDIADLLEIPDDGGNRAERAYDTVVDRSGDWGLSGASLGYTCDACQGSIIDHGPFESHPEDNETGHAADCARFAAEIAAWRARYPES